MSLESGAAGTGPEPEDKPREECGVFGIYHHNDAAAYAALGLHALQHRGQEAAGIVSYDGERFRAHRAPGLVGDTFASGDVVDRLQGIAAVGHNRYATSGETAARNIQPLYADFAFGGFAVCHNGNLTNAKRLRHDLVERGCLFQSTTDTEVIVHLMAAVASGTVTERLTAALRRVQGAYSLVCMAAGRMIGVRDPLGVRPLMLGRVGDAYVLCSESCALDIIDGEVIRDLEPGEMVVVDEANELYSYHPFVQQGCRFCVFEHIYFARPDSTIEGDSVYDARRRIGAELARESYVPADMVVPVPDSGTPAALGYSDASGLPFELGIIRNHYIGRTFIEPTEQIRHFGVKLKHSPNAALIRGKRIVLVDDSIVRGTTSMKIVAMMRSAGAAEIHMRISAPPTRYSCFYGIDTPNREKLLAARMDEKEMAEYIGVDSLAYVSINGLYRAMGYDRRHNERPQFCDACFTGDYPIPLEDVENAERDADSQLSLLDYTKG